MDLITAARSTSLLCALALGASGCSLVMPNSMGTRGEAPFKLGSLTSALFFEGAYSDADEGYGQGILMLTDADMDCDDLEDELTGDTEQEDSVMWNHAGIAAVMTWMQPGEDAGFEGTYVSGFYPYATYQWYEDPEVATRIFAATAFSDGVSYDEEYGSGWLEISSAEDQIVGRLKTDWLKARFRAEDCGKEPEDDSGSWSGSDTGW